MRIQNKLTPSIAYQEVRMAEKKKKYVIGIDTGGTFTDIVVMDVDTGEIMLSKSPTTPHDFSVGVMNALEAAAKAMRMERKILLQQTKMLKHGTTVGTNAIITGAGSRVGFITTKGFEDTTLIGRAIQRVDGVSMDDIKRMAYITKPKPLVPKSRIRGIYERIDFQGNIVIPLNIEDGKQQIRSLVEDEKVDAIAVSLIFSLVNPTHEMKIKALINELYPDKNLFLTFSHELVPLAKEYGRANTVILNCFVGRIMEAYLTNLERKLHEEGFEGSFLVMQASGGAVSRERVAPIRTVSSGPAGGVIGSQYMAGLLGHQHVIGADMGGTSFDVSLIRAGKWSYEREPIISRWRVMLPIIKVESIGAGGGTIARVDPVTKRLLVGPESAGAAPGPVCYDTGGTEPTVCDANLTLGFLNPAYFLGGEMTLNKTKAESALKEKIADPLNMGVVEAAAGIFTIINAHMAELIRVCAMGVGLAPEEFVIYAFGGTGPIHAAFYARELAIKQVYVFPTSPVFSAFGIAGTDIIQTASFSLGCVLPVEPETLNARVKEYEGALAEAMEMEGFSRNELEFRHLFNMRYRRQVNYHTIALPGKDYTTDRDIQNIVDAWMDDFESVYGKGVAYTKAGIELVSMDIEAIGKTVKPALKATARATEDPSAAHKGRRNVFFPEMIRDFIQTDLYEYGKLQAGNVLAGPAIIESPVSTIVVPPGCVARVDRFLNIIIEL